MSVCQGEPGEGGRQIDDWTLIAPLGKGGNLLVRDAR
jgi:hypothetical protein